MLKLRILALAVLTMLLTCSLVVAQSISLDHVDGLNGPGVLEMGAPVTFHIRITGDDNDYAAITNGFRVYSVNGAQWGGLIGDTTGTLGGTQFDGIFVVNNYGVDGFGADTVAFGGFSIFSAGLPAGFDDIAYTIQIGPIDSAYAGGQICLDSCYWPPTGRWLWTISGGDRVFPSWDGPHCYSIGYEVPYPEITCPGDTTVLVWAPDTLCFPFDTANADWVTVTTPAYIDNDLVCVPVLQPGSQTIIMTAGIPGIEYNCSFTLTANIIYPEITCPGDTTVLLCAPDTFCFPFDTANADWVTVSAPAYIDNDQVCVPVLQSGLHTFTMIAGIPIFEVSCSFIVSAIVNVPPTVSMAADSQTIMTCDLNSPYCMAFSVDDPNNNNVDTSVSIGYVYTSGGYSYVCFVPDTAGVFDVSVTATDSCGATDTETNRITIVQGEFPMIECPAPVVDTLCEGTTVCVPITISPDTARVTTSHPGLYNWETGQVCVDVGESGFYEVRVIAETECGADTCYVQLDMAVYETPEISCPGEVVSGGLCEPGIACTFLKIDNADSVIVDNGSWDSGRLCFPADTTGVYTFAISAYSWCGEDHCELTVNVTDECPEVRATLEWDSLNVADGNLVAAPPATVYLEVMATAYTVHDLDPAAMLLNGELPPDSTAILSSHPGSPGEVMAVFFPIHWFVDYYMPVWDTVATTWTIFGGFVGGSPFVAEGPIVFMGHIYGDVNSDGATDISDLVYLVDHYFLGGPAPPLLGPADLDGNGVLDITDLVWLVDYMFGL